MTVTRYIGNINSFSENDKLTPYVGYKVVAIKTPNETGDITLVGPHYYYEPYGFSADSSCEKHNNRDGSKFKNCTCGFYSYSEVPDVIRHWRNACGGHANNAIVKVALSQKVVVCENGYRASHQRVTKLLMGHCWNCPNSGTHMIPHTSGTYVTGCDTCISQFKAQDSAITFEDFSKMITPKGVPLIDVGSAQDLGKEAQGFLYPEYDSDQAKKYISKIADRGDVFALQALLSELNATIEETTKTAFKDVV